MPSNTCQHPVTGKEAEEPGLGGRASTLFPDDASLFIHPSDGLGRPDRCPHSGKGSRLLREGSHMEEVSLCYACWGWQKQVKDWGGGDHFPWQSVLHRPLCMESPSLGYIMVENYLLLG
jgi:hypothetical protein